MNVSRPGKGARPASVKAHWVVLAAVLLALGLALAVQGYVHHLGGVGYNPAAAGQSAVTVPESVTQGGPVVTPAAERCAPSVRRSAPSP